MRNSCRIGSYTSDLQESNGVESGQRGEVKQSQSVWNESCHLIWRTKCECGHKKTTKSRLSGNNEWVKATSNENRFYPIASSHVRFPRGRGIFVLSFSCSLFPESFGRPKFGPQFAIPKKLERCRPNSSDGVVVVSDSSAHRQQLPGEFGVQFLVVVVVLLVLRLFIIIIIIISFLLSAEFEQTHQLYCSPGHGLWGEEDELGGRV